jgi:predicted metal-binding membrane protein
MFAIDRRVNPGVAAGVLVAAAVAWCIVAVESSGMSSAAGTMGFGLAGFIAFWTVMMAAMMLPSAVRAASAYASLGAGSPAGRATGMLAGYLGAWAAVGLVAFVAADLVGRLASEHPLAARRAGAVVLIGAGIYQLSPLKNRWLTHCRSPVGSFIGHGRGAWRHIRAGLSHGRDCIGCCAGLMVALIALGIMDLRWMAALAVVVVLEKNWARGRWVATAAAVALVLLGVIAIWHPGLVPGFRTQPMGGM